MDYALVGLFGFLAGFIDAIVGGGGLIQIPALLVLFPTLAPAAVFGTNKFASVFGTVAALVTYARKIKIPWYSMLPTTACAIGGSFFGANLVSLIEPALLKPFILLLLVLVAGYTWQRKSLGRVHLPRYSRQNERVISALIGLALGFYDGFFGPGTGTFLVFLFVGVLGYNFLVASVSAKVVNVATNASALVYFVLTNNVLYRYAVPMAVCNLLGSVIGSKLAISRGVGFVRALFLVVVGMLCARFAYDLW